MKYLLNVSSFKIDTLDKMFKKCKAFHEERKLLYSNAHMEYCNIDNKNHSSKHKFAAVKLYCTCLLTYAMSYKSTARK
jgi:hypothetical protein